MASKLTPEVREGLEGQIKSNLEQMQTAGLRGVQDVGNRTRKLYDFLREADETGTVPAKLVDYLNPPEV